MIEDDLRHPLDADWSEQAVDLADHEALEGVDDVLRAEIQQIRLALLRIENGTYGTCSKCGKDIRRERLEARPIATRCIDCAWRPRQMRKRRPYGPPYLSGMPTVWRRKTCEAAYFLSALYFLRESPPKRLLNAATRPPS